jgi:hypothetical protein
MDNVEESGVIVAGTLMMLTENVKKHMGVTLQLVTLHGVVENITFGALVMIPMVTVG